MRNLEIGNYYHLLQHPAEKAFLTSFNIFFGYLATFRILWDRPFAQTGQYGCLQCWSNHVPTKKLEGLFTIFYIIPLPIFASFATCEANLANLSKF